MNNSNRPNHNLCRKIEYLNNNKNGSEKIRDRVKCDDDNNSHSHQNEKKRVNYTFEYGVSNAEKLWKLLYIVVVAIICDVVVDVVLSLRFSTFRQRNSRGSPEIMITFAFALKHI